MFIGRNAELELLNKSLERDKASFIVVHGRRRLGKTRIIEEFLKEKPEGTFHYYLVPEQTETIIMRELSREIGKHVFGSDEITVSNFPEFLTLLEKASQEVYARTGQKFILVLDEFQRLLTANRSIPSYLQKKWDASLKNAPFYLIVSGSAVTMMEKIFFDKKASLYGRRTGSMKVGPLSIKDLKTYFGFDWTTAFYVYGLIGGVPYYWENIAYDTSKNLGQNIADNFFKKGLFLDEGNFLLREETQEPKVYLSILDGIAHGHRNLGSLSKYLGMKNTDLTAYLEVLQRLNIIEKDPPLFFSKKSDYIVSDPFVNFWFRYVRQVSGPVELGVPPIALLSRMEGSIGEYYANLYETMWRATLRKLFSKMDVGKVRLRSPLVDGEIDVAGVEGNKLIFIAEIKFKKNFDNGDLAQLDRNLEIFRKIHPKIDTEKVVKIAIAPSLSAVVQNRGLLHLDFPAEAAVLIKKLKPVFALETPSSTQKNKGRAILDFKIKGPGEI